MSNLDKEREEVERAAFEHWCVDVYGWKRGMLAIDSVLGEEYLNADVNYAWIGWKGARASLAAESKPIWEKLAEIGKDMPSPLTDDLDPTIHGE